MINEHTVVIKNIIRQTDDSISIELDIPHEAQQSFLYRQGQNITLIKNFGDEEVRRSYSICSSVREQVIRLGIKQVEGGLFSTWANRDLKEGDALKALPPTGHFYTELNPTNEHHYVGIAAGSGITPILSILKTTLETEPKSSFTLLYGNKTTDSIMFLEEIENLKNRYTNRLELFHVLSRESQQTEFLNGRIGRDKVEFFLQSILSAEAISHVFLCGPYDMVTSAKQAFIDAGLSSKCVHTELFGTPEDLKAIGAREKPALSDEELKSISQLQVIIDDKKTKISLARGGENILDAALKVRKDLPFACKGGVCATCKAKVISGDVEMDVNYSLSEEEVEAGFILTCQAHPVSDEVVVSFDEK